MLQCERNKHIIFCDNLCSIARLVLHNEGQLFASKYLKSGAAMLINDVVNIVSATRRRWILIWKLESRRRHSLNAQQNKSLLRPHSAWCEWCVAAACMHTFKIKFSQTAASVWEWKFIYVRFCMAVLMSIRRVKLLCADWKSCSAMLILITHVKIYIERESAETLFAFYGRRRLWMELFNTKFHNVGKDVINF